MPNSSTELFSTVYLIRNIKTRAYKIGKANNPTKRLKQLQTGNEGKLEIVGIIVTAQALYLERKLHRVFSAFRRNGEWFEFDEKNEKLILAIFGKVEASEHEIAAFKRLGFR